MKSFYFFLVKTDHFWRFKAFLKKWKLKRKFSDNLGQEFIDKFSKLGQKNMYGCGYPTVPVKQTRNFFSRESAKIIEDLFKIL